MRETRRQLETLGEMQRHLLPRALPHLNGRQLAAHYIVRRSVRCTIRSCNRRKAAIIGPVDEFMEDRESEDDITVLIVQRQSGPNWRVKVAIFTGDYARK